MKPTIFSPFFRSTRLVLASFSFAGRFHEPNPDAYKWNIVIRGLLELQKREQAYMVYAQLRREGLKVDSHTLLFIIRTCEFISIALAGEQIHGHIFKMGFELEVILQTALLRMYGLFQQLDSAQKVFDETPDRDLAQWNALITTFARSDHPYKALKVSCAMITENVKPNEVTAVCMLSVCSLLRDVIIGSLFHGYLIKSSVRFDIFIHNALIDMYAKCSYVNYACQVYKEMPIKNVISWTSMINAFSDNNEPEEAVGLFMEMESKGVVPDVVTLLNMVSACSKLGCSEMGDWFEDYIKKNGYEGNVKISNSLINMHAKCGNIEKACRVFDQMVVRSLVTWTTMIQGLGFHGRGIEALVRFSQMQREGFKPDSVVFVSILSACSHAGLVEEGRKCFKSMTEEHGMVPRLDHYGCMVDLLCRAELVYEAFEFVLGMPIEPDEKIWRALVGACKNKGDIVLVRKVMTRLLESEPKYRGNYILISNLCAAINEWELVEDIRQNMKHKGVGKGHRGHSLVEVTNSVNTS